MIVSVLENRLIHGDLRGQLTPGVLYVASDSKRFYLADANGFARPADQQDPALFASLLESEIPQAPTPQWAAFLQNTLNALVSSPQPPAPARYPEVGDTNVSGSIVWVRTLPTDNPKFTCGKVRADIAANGYSTPDASVQPPINFDFDFYINPPVNLVAGQPCGSTSCKVGSRRRLKSSKRTTQFWRTILAAMKKPADVLSGLRAGGGHRKATEKAPVVPRLFHPA